MAAQIKPNETQSLPAGAAPLETADRVVELASEHHQAAPSPAHALQAGLRAEFGPREFPYTHLQVYSSIIVFCFAVWWALYQLVAGLV